MRRRRLPTPMTGPALALAAVLAPAALAAHATLERELHPRYSSTPAATAFRISGDLLRPLTPGATQRLNLRLSNRSGHRLLITKLTISLRIDDAHRRAGCSRTRSFRVTRLKRREYPISLPARRTRTLRALGVRRVPSVRMLDLPRNQDACKGAALRLRYSGRARRARATPAP